ncbi:hypothetical protein [Pontivivens insulae]|uniref:Uncharacterized protein n=1 Tax=Pontivivens insulae TaxID=1639689 RepID=A0A2R8AFX8_9RHOB|nr:hypothetical protein [Pontivivens insulae]RED10689.1 hypothetical protein DFR53_3508 [Pontivivens insulae]SPF31097.1 hypothetical protein POI8812_03448 [Pontivivens insulae]
MTETNTSKPDTKLTIQFHHMMRNDEFNNLVDDLDLLFGDSDRNPLHRDLLMMKVMLPSSNEFWTALQSLGDAAKTLNALGIGQASHIGGSHVGYGDFILSNARDILRDPKPGETGRTKLTDVKKRARVIDLFEFAKHAALDGNPPSMEADRETFQRVYDAHLSNHGVSSTSRAPSRAMLDQADAVRSQLADKPVDQRYVAEGDPGRKAWLAEAYDKLAEVGLDPKSPKITEDRANITNIWLRPLAMA